MGLGPENEMPVKEGYVPNEELSKIIKYSFNNVDVLKEALTHPSTRSTTLPVKDSERLEFLGDSILHMVVSDILFKMYPNDNEGDLSKRRQDLVCGKSVANIGKKIKISEFIFLNAENNGNGNHKNSLENAVEALIGAIYIDGGYRKARTFVYRHWAKLAKNCEESNHKSALLIWAQRNNKGAPAYEVVNTVGPHHERLFTISASIDQVGEASATDTTKRAAEHEAARLLMDLIHKSGPK